MCVLRGWIWNRMFYRHIFSVLSWHAWRQQIRTESFLNNFHSSSPCCHRDEEVLCGRCLVWDSGRGATFTVRSVLLIIVKMSCRITNWARIERLDSADESRCYRSQKLPMVSVRKKKCICKFHSQNTMYSDSFRHTYLHMHAYPHANTSPPQIHSQLFRFSFIIWRQRPHQRTTISTPHQHIGRCSSALAYTSSTSKWKTWIGFNARCVDALRLDKWFIGRGNIAVSLTICYQLNVCGVGLDAIARTKREGSTIFDEFPLKAKHESIFSGADSCGGSRRSEILIALRAKNRWMFQHWMCSCHRRAIDETGLSTGRHSLFLSLSHTLSFHAHQTRTHTFRYGYQAS